MFTKLSLSFFLLINLTLAATAQERSTNVLSTNLIGGWNAVVSDGDVYYLDLSYERALSEKFSGVVEIETGSYEAVRTRTGGGKILSEGSRTASGFLLEGRFYPLRRKRVAPRGLFVGAYFQQYFVNEEFSVASGLGSGPLVKITDENYTAGGIGADVGYKIGKGWFVVEPLAGYAFNWHNGIGENEEIPTGFEDFDAPAYFVRLELRVGIAF